MCIIMTVAHAGKKKIIIKGMNVCAWFLLRDVKEKTHSVEVCCAWNVYCCIVVVESVLKSLFDSASITTNYFVLRLLLKKKRKSIVKCFT